MLSRATFLPLNNRRKNFHDELRYLSFLQFIRRKKLGRRLRNNRYLWKKFPKMSSRYVSAIYIHNFPKGIHDCHKNFSEQFGSIRLSSPPNFLQLYIVLYHSEHDTFETHLIFFPKPCLYLLDVRKMRRGREKFNRGTILVRLNVTAARTRYRRDI